MKKLNPKKDKAIFVDIDGTLIEEVSDIHDPKDVKLLPWVGKTIAKLNEEFLIIAITNKSSIEKGYCSEGDLAKIFRKIKKELVSYNARIDRIYYCPHREESDCQCRKPKTQLIFNSLKEFEKIDLNKSWLIGDKSRDIQLGVNLKNLGYRDFKTIGLETGHGINDREFNVKPDFYVKNFSEAAKIIKGQASIIHTT